MPALVAALGAGAAAACLHGLGRGELAAPPDRSPAGLADWYDSIGAVAATAVVVRLVATLVAGWLCLALLLQVLASRRSGAIRGIADAISPAALRTLGHRMAGMSLSAGLAVPLAAAPAPLAPPPAVDAAAEVTASESDRSPQEGLAVMRPLGDEAVPTTSSTTTTADTGTDPFAASTTSTTVHPTPETPPAAPVASDPDRYTVSPGECLWSIADELVSESLGRSASDAEVAGYWRRLVDANASGLPSGDPDVIFPGQELVLPPL